MFFVLLSDSHLFIIDLSIRYFCYFGRNSWLTNKLHQKSLTRCKTIWANGYYKCRYKSFDISYWRTERSLDICKQFGLYSYFNFINHFHFNNSSSHQSIRYREILFVVTALTQKLSRYKAYSQNFDSLFGYRSGVLAAESAGLTHYNNLFPRIEAHLIDCLTFDIEHKSRTLRTISASIYVNLCDIFIRVCAYIYYMKLWPLKFTVVTPNLPLRN